MYMIGMKRVGLTLSIALMATACVTTDPTRVVIDPQYSVDGGANYQRDRAECADLAYNAYPEGSGAQDAAGNAVAGAAGGAAIGAILGAIFGGDVSNSAGAGAALGGISGLAGSAGEVDARRAQIIRNCLDRRGYAVLDRY